MDGWTQLNPWPTEKNCSDLYGKILHFERFCSNLGKFTLTYLGRLSSSLSLTFSGSSLNFVPLGLFEFSSITQKLADPCLLSM